MTDRCKFICIRDGVVQKKVVRKHNGLLLEAPAASGTGMPEAKSRLREGNAQPARASTIPFPEFQNIATFGHYEFYLVNDSINTPYSIVLWNPYQELV